jgi:hypothetical protein
MSERLRALPGALLVLVVLTSTGRAQEGPEAILQKALSREALTEKVLLSARSARSWIAWSKDHLEFARQDARHCADAAAAQTRRLEAAALAGERARAAVQEAHLTAFRFAAASDRLRSAGQAAG